MNVPLPDLTQRVVGFGGAASMVHPASGYLIASVLRRAPELASAVAQVLGRDALPEEGAAAAWRALWPKEQVRAQGTLSVRARGPPQSRQYPAQKLF